MKIFDWIIIGENDLGFEYLIDRVKDEKRVLWINKYETKSHWVSFLQLFKNNKHNYKKIDRILEVNNIQIIQTQSIDLTLHEYCRKIHSLQRHIDDIEIIGKQINDFLLKFSNSENLKNQNIFSEAFWQLPPKLHQFYQSFYEQKETEVLTWENLSSYLADQICTIAQSEVHRRYLFLNLFFPAIQHTHDESIISKQVENFGNVKIDGLMGTNWEISINNELIQSKNLILNDDKYWVQNQNISKINSSIIKVSSNKDHLATNNSIMASSNWRHNRPLSYWERDSFRNLKKLKPNHQLATIQGIESAYFAYPRVFSPLI